MTTTTRTPTFDGSSLILDGLPGFFTLHYQPEFDLRDHTVAGCESLLRWWHPDFGMLRPGASLHRTRWATDLRGAEEWAVVAACRQAAAWREQGRPMQVALNVSRRLLTEPRFPHLFDAAISDSDVDPRDLAIDVPLAAFTRHRIDALPNIAVLAELGVTIVCDGVTGDVRLALEHTPASVLKIELHSAGRRLQGLHPSVQVGLQVARDLGAIAVAKAVETDADLDELQAMGFERGFGHVFGPAVDADELLEVVDAAGRRQLA
jgi:EAL domain-containing protein (putative c-di-GMP-specific phosphodiesterase class I)